MQASLGERRKKQHHIVFPLKDSHGQLIAAERRSGNERRKNKRGADVVGKILNMLN